MSILRTTGLLIMALCALFFCLVSGESAVPQGDLDRILLSSETFFKVMRSGDHVKVWSMLSSKSHRTIVKDISRAVGTEYSTRQIEDDLSKGGPIAVSYWRGFLESFDPDTILEKSRWEVGYIASDRAELLITYRKSKRPARLQMFREDGAWKVGLVETFWTRK